MDRKSILVLAICAVLMIAWFRLARIIYPDIPVPTMTNQVTGATNPAGPITNQAEIGAAPGTATSVTPGKFIAQTNVPEQLLLVSNKYAVLTFTSRGGGLKEVKLPGYPESVSTLRKKKSAITEFATLNTATVPPVLAIVGDESVQGDGNYQLSPLTNGVRAEKTLGNGLTIIKEFQLGDDYLVTGSVRFKNGSGKPLSVAAHEWVVGTATPMNQHDTGSAVMVYGYNGVSTESPGLGSVFNTNRTTMFVFARSPKTDFKFASSNIVWSSVQNQYFALAAMPQQPAIGLRSHIVDLPPPSAEEVQTVPGTVRNPHGLQTEMAFPGVTLTAGQETTNGFKLYAGPREYQRLARLGQQLDNHIELIMNLSGFIGSIARGLLAAMNWMHHSIALPYGWAIVTITVLIKAIFWPLTQYSTKSMKKMQVLGPQLKVLQEKYKDDPQKLQAKTWEFYKKNKVNPVSSCFPMLLQLPVLYGLFRMLQSAIELRGAPFLWIGDLSQPDTVFIIPGLNFPLNPMPLVMGATMLWQSHLTPPSPGMDPGQQRLMRYLPLIFLFLLYNFSSGLALYWTVQNLLSILQTKLINAQTPPPSTPTPTQTSAQSAPQKKGK
jgi:YidC/Oxa1 family membrane protein insertase